MLYTKFFLTWNEIAMKDIKALSYCIAVILSIFSYYCYGIEKEYKPPTNFKNKRYSKLNPVQKISHMQEWLSEVLEDINRMSTEDGLSKEEVIEELGEMHKKINSFYDLVPPEDRTYTIKMIMVINELQEAVKTK